MSPFVVDASVAVKWALPEDGSELAERLVTGGAQLHAPAFIFLELANVLWKRIDPGRSTMARRRICWPACAARRYLWQGEEPLPAALGLASARPRRLRLRLLALALHLDAVYVTADQRFWRKAQGRAELAGRVLRLADLAEPG